MADNLEIKGPQDGKTINTSQQHELDYWTKKFGVTEVELKAGVKAAGTQATDVEKHLNK